MENFDQFLSWEATTRDTIDFKKIYVDIAGDLVAGLMLSQIVYWYLPDRNGNTKIRVKNKFGYWIAKAHNEWYSECRITEWQAPRALAILEKKGILETKVCRYNGSPTMHLRLYKDAFMRLWQEQLLINEADREKNKGDKLFGNEGSARIEESELPESLTETTTENTNTSPKNNFSETPDLTHEQNPNSFCVDPNETTRRSQEVIDAKANACGDYVFEKLRIMFTVPPFSNAHAGKGWRPPTKLKPEQLEKLRVISKSMKGDVKAKALDPALRKFKEVWAQAINASGNVNTKHPGLDMIIDFAHAIALNEMERIERNQLLRLDVLDNSPQTVVNSVQVTANPGYISPRAENGYWFEITADGTKRHHFEDIK